MRAYHVVVVVVMLMKLMLIIAHFFSHPRGFQILSFSGIGAQPGSDTPRHSFHVAIDTVRLSGVVSRCVAGKLPGSLAIDYWRKKNSYLGSSESFKSPFFHFLSLSSFFPRSQILVPR